MSSRARNRAPADSANRWVVFTVVAAGVFMATVDSSMVNIALPTIMADFNSPLKDTEWVVLVYLLTITSSLLIWGSLSDRLGRYRIYPAGMTVFALGSLACAQAPQLACLTAARFFQAVGAAMMMSTGPAIIKENFPGRRLGRTLGLISVATSLGLMSGPLAGGLIMEFFSWRAIFMVTVPIGLGFALLGAMVIPRRRAEGPARQFSWRSAFIWVAMLVFLSLAITHAAAPDWSRSRLGALFAAFAFLLTVFIVSEKTTAAPFLPHLMLRRRYFAAALACATLSFLVLFTVLIMTPFFLDRVLALPKAKIGLVMMVIPLAVLVVAPTAGRLSENVKARTLTTAGLALSACGAFWLAALTPEASPAGICAKLALLGGGQALFLPPNSASVLKRMEAGHAGKAAALLATARNFGMLLGIGLAGLVFTQSFAASTGGLDMKDFSPEHTGAFMRALRHTFRVAGAIGCVGVLLSWKRE